MVMAPVFSYYRCHMIESYDIAYCSFSIMLTCSTLIAPLFVL